MAESFGELLKRLRTAAGMTQEELAVKARISTRSVSDLERGINRTPRKWTAELLAEALELKGQDRAEFDALASGRAVAEGPVRGTAGATRTLPRDPTLFIGREGELRQLVNAAASPARVVGIHAIGGMAGVGKTAFAVHVAHRLAPRFPDGQVFLPLHGHTPGHQPVAPTDALTSLLLTAGVAASHIPPDLEARMALWRDHMADKQLLLLLDDAASSDQVRPLLPGAGDSLVLVTSRRHLVALEDAHAISLDTLPPGEAAELFTRLAARPEVNADDTAVTEVIRLCGYLPLVIGMMARQLHHHPAWTAADLAADLLTERDRLELMAAENLSVAAAFDLSYQDLPEAQQRLFRQLGLHPGTDIDIYATAALGGISLAAAQRGLAGLYDHYLLTEPERGRYRLHDLIREHARTRAEADPVAERDAALARLLAYYLHTASAANQHLGRRVFATEPTAGTAPPGHAPEFESREHAAAWMSAERVNLHAITDRAASHNDSAQAVGIPATMHGFLRTQGYWDQALALHRTALDVAHDTGDRLAQAGALTDLGDMQFMTGDYAAATTSLSLALEISREVSSKPAEAEALKGLGMVHFETGDMAAAAASIADALALFRELGNRLGEAGTLAPLAVVQQAAGDYTEALANQSLALNLNRELGNRSGEANALNFLGVVHQTMGNYAAAIDSQRRALALNRELGNRFGEANALNHLGIAQQTLGEYAAAASTQEEALRLYRDLGHRMGEANVLNCLGGLAQRTGDYAAGAAHLEQALRLFRDLGIALGEAEVLNTMGELSLAAARPAEARARHERARSIADRIVCPPEQARALVGIAQCDLRASQRETAMAALRQALAIYEQIQHPQARRVADTLREMSEGPEDGPGR